MTEDINIKWKYWQHNNPLNISQEKVVTSANKNETGYHIADCYKHDAPRPREVWQPIRKSDKLAQIELYRAVLFDAMMGYFTEDFLKKVCV